MNGKILVFHVKYFDHGSCIPTVRAALLLISQGGRESRR